MSTAGVLPAYRDEPDTVASTLPPLTIVGPEAGAICHGHDSPRAPSPAQTRTYDGALVSIFPHLFRPTGPASGPAGSRGRQEIHRIEMEEDHESTYVLAASLLAARRMTEAVRLLRRVDDIAAARPGWQLWRCRSEFLWAVYAEQTGDLPAVLEHAARAAHLIDATIVRPQDNGNSDECRLLQTVDAIARERLPLLAARAKMGLGELHEARTILEDQYGSTRTRPILANLL